MGIRKDILENPTGTPARGKQLAEIDPHGTIMNSAMSATAMKRQISSSKLNKNKVTHDNKFHKEKVEKMFQDACHAGEKFGLQGLKEREI